ncbi:MAG: hypothetical protein K2X28_01235 [Alphaproteobacteria bacterium]|nr:hypothetical protein [Alphaproteobacteria bacterium]
MWGNEVFPINQQLSRIGIGLVFSSFSIKSSYSLVEIFIQANIIWNKSNVLSGETIGSIHLTSEAKDKFILVLREQNQHFQVKTQGKVLFPAAYDIS